MDTVSEQYMHLIKGHWFFRDSVYSVCLIVFCLTVMQSAPQKMQTFEDTLGLNLLLHRSDASMLGSWFLKRMAGSNLAISLCNKMKHGI